MKKVVCKTYVILIAILLQPFLYSGIEKPVLFAQTPHEWTVEELGEKIVVAGTFWENWWELKGRFDIKHIGDEIWADWQEEGEILTATGIYGNLLPSSDFKSMDDIRNYLLQFYTENWVEKELSDELPKFVENNDMLFVETSRFGSEIDRETGEVIPLSSRYGGLQKSQVVPNVQTNKNGFWANIYPRIRALLSFGRVPVVASTGYELRMERMEVMEVPRPNWETATHTLVKQDGGLVVVDTVVYWKNVSREFKDTPVLYRFTFINGKINSIENPYLNMVTETQIRKDANSKKIETEMEWSTFRIAPSGSFEPWFTLSFKCTHTPNNKVVKESVSDRTYKFGDTIASGLEVDLGGSHGVVKIPKFTN